MLWAKDLELPAQFHFHLARPPPPPTEPPLQPSTRIGGPACHGARIHSRFSPRSTIPESDLFATIDKSAEA
ncbi:hypothetical protein J6590_037803 [Homalodisca vitripennis]|nr:hypothetical protein J6590_037803 [Homalodisca vitripennis]